MPPTQPQHRVLVVGAGSIGERHVRCFQSTGRATVAIVEPNDTVRQAVASRCEVEHAFASLDESLEHPWDTAVIATPAPSHIPIATQFAERKIHTLIEKPLSTTLDGIAHLDEIIRRHDLVCAVAYVWRSYPLLAEMRDAIQTERFGRPVQFHIISGQNFPHYRPAYRQIYYASHAQGGGAIQDALTHLINAGEWLLGPITSITTDASHQLLPGVEVEDTVHALARHGPVMAAYLMNQYQAPNETVLTVVCERGTIRLEAHHDRLMWITDPAATWHTFPNESYSRDAWYGRQANSFLDAVERKAPVLCSLDDALQTLKVSLNMLAAFHTPIA